jgi:hypothetical protein
MRPNLLALVLIFASACGGAAGLERRLNNLVSEVLDVSSPSEAGRPLTFARSNDGWVLISAHCHGKGHVTLTLDRDKAVVVDSGPRMETMRHVSKGLHTINLARKEGVRVDRLSVKAIPELMHCGLGFNPEIKSYGVYDMDFLSRDILPNVTTLIVPNNLKPSEAVIADWHRQGKRFVAEVGIHSQAKTAEDHFKYSF